MTTVMAVWTTLVGLPAVILRHAEMGHLCGYVGVGKQHPWYGKKYTDCALDTAHPRGPVPDPPAESGWLPLPESWKKQREMQLICGEEDCDHRPESLISVHGGITYSSWGYDPIPRNGEWWFGFECAHAGDLVPGIRSGSRGDVFRDEAYVREQCESLAAQLSVRTGE